MGSPTHIKGNVLDLVLTSNEEAVTSLKVHPGVDSPFKLDHFMVSFSLAVNTVCPSCSATSLVFDYSKADWEGLCGYLLDSTTKKELAYLLSRLCTVDATTMQVRRVVNGQVVPPFAEGATLP